MSAISLQTEPGKYPLVDLLQASLRDHLSQETADLYVGLEYVLTGNGVAHEDENCLPLAYRTELFNRMLIHAFIKLHGDELMLQAMQLSMEHL